MKKKWKNGIIMLFLMVPCLILAQNEKPVISNIHFQNNVATKTLSIFFDVFDQEESEVEVLLRASFNDGEHFFIRTDTAFGDIGFPVETGSGKLITWYYGDFWDDVEGKTLRLIADDLYEINVDDIVDQIDTNRLKAMLQYIGQPRSFQYGMDHLYKVRDTLDALLTSYNYNVIRQEFDYETFTGTNVIGRKQGLAEERKTIIMDAHYDAFFNAPGADDNGSGVVGFMEAARVLSAYDFDKSIEFIGFDSEENFLLGSINYVYFGGIEPWKQVEAVLNYEMIGYFSEEVESQVFPEGFDLLFPSQYNELIADSFRGNFIFIVGNNPSIDLVTAFDAATTNYVQDLKVICGIVPLNGLVAPDLLRSDHAPFWFRGIPGLFITDGAEFRNSNYHTENDVIENLDFEFMANVTKASMATMIELAGIRHSTIETFVVEDVITGLNYNNFEHCKLSIYPNPTSERLKVQSFNCRNNSEKIKVSIYDLSGRLVLTQEMSTNLLELNITDLSCGQYTLEFDRNGSVQIHKFVVH